jgi:trimethylamine:corrinoid methyltransferase-like protein
MRELISNGLVEEMLSAAYKLILDKGIMTRHKQLLQKAGSSSILRVKGDRIFPSREALSACLVHLKQNQLPPGDSFGNHHGWPDSIINKNDENKLVVRVTDLPYQFCDHRSRQIIPLTRKHVIEGTKLLHVLSEQQGIQAYSCGVPQDTASPLKSIEQYIIGFRYNQNGGATIQSVAAEVETEFNQIRCVAEGRDNYHERSLMIYSPSPMILDADEIDLCFKPGIEITSYIIGSMPMMGMTGPVDPIGVYILSLAEVLGGAAILHALYPEAKAFVFPHPQAMDLRTGQMAFGTLEHARLEMLKLQIMDALGLPYYNVKDIMTSAQMPGSMAQGDKALGFFTGLIAGYKAFNMMTLSTDQGWSPVQALLDIEALKNAWATIQPVNDSNAVVNATRTISQVIDEGSLFAVADDTLLNMFEYYQSNPLHNRFFTSEAWSSAGSPVELKAIEDKCQELLSYWRFNPDQDKLEKIMTIYNKLCKKFTVDPLQLD